MRKIRDYSDILEALKAIEAIIDSDEIHPKAFREQQAKLKESKKRVPGFTVHELNAEVVDTAARIRDSLLSKKFDDKAKFDFGETNGF